MSHMAINKRNVKWKPINLSRDKPDCGTEWPNIFITCAINDKRKTENCAMNQKTYKKSINSLMTMDSTIEPNQYVKYIWYLEPDFMRWTDLLWIQHNIKVRQKLQHMSFFQGLYETHDVI